MMCDVTTYRFVMFLALKVLPEVTVLLMSVCLTRAPSLEISTRQATYPTKSIN